MEIKRFPILLMLILITTFFFTSTSYETAQQTLKYDWLDLSMKNGTTYELPGGYQLQAYISEFGGHGTHAVKASIYKEGKVCVPWVAVPVEKVGNLETRKLIEVKEDCSVSGKRLYYVYIKGDLSKGAGEAIKDTIYFDILNSIYSPEVNLTATTTFPKRRDFGEKESFTFTIPFSIKNNAENIRVNWVRIVAAWHRVGGVGSINLTNVEVTGAPPPSPSSWAGGSLNLTLPGLDPGESRQIKLTFLAGPNSKDFGNYTINVMIIHPAVYEFIGLDPDRGVKQFKYNPNNTESDSFQFVVFTGTRYAGHTGKPELTILLTRPTGDVTVDPGSTVTFDFRVKNNGNDYAYNVTLDAKVKPDAQITIVKPDNVAGNPFPIVVPVDVPPGGLTEPIQFRVKLPEDSEGKIYRVNITASYFTIRGEYRETSKSVLITVREIGESKVTIKKKVSPTSISVNGTIQVVVTVSNNGTAPASNVVIKDYYPKEYFRLVSGETSKKISSLAPGDSVSIVYKLKAIKEGIPILPPASVTYVDPKTGPKGPITSGESSVVITVIKPKLWAKVEDQPPNVTVKNSLVTFSIYVKNDGNGAAKDVSLYMELSPGYYMVTPPTVEKSEGTICDQPKWEPTKDKVKVSVSCDKVDPQGWIKLSLTLRPQSEGKQWLTVKSLTYKSADGTSKFHVPVSYYSYETVVVTPFEQRMFSLVLFSFSVILVGLFVIALTRGFGFTASPRRRRVGRLGAFE